MKKRHLAIIPVLGAVGLVSLAPSAFASEKPQEHLFSGQRMEQCEDSEKCMKKMQKRHEHKRAIFGENKEELRTIFETGDFDSFQALMLENRPEDAPEPTSEQLEKMEEHFNKMIERFGSGDFEKPERQAR